MLVILKREGTIQLVENVFFQDAHKPTVNGVCLQVSETENIDNEESFQYIESVLWFKTYMVSAIFIDCDRRDVVWYRSDIDSFFLQTEELLKSGPPNGSRLFEDVDVYDYDPTIDELTDRAIDVMELLSEGKISMIKFTAEIVRIIHCYILPSLRFTSQDLDNLVKAGERVDNLLLLTENEIVQKGKCVDLSANSLDKQRQRILKTENMHSETYVRTCDKDFLSYFLLHIEKEIVNIDAQLTQYQFQINKIRNISKSDNSQIESLRGKRDLALYKLQKLQIVRENIKNVIRRQSKLKKKRKSCKIKQNVFHDIYRELSVRLQEQKEELHKLVLKKLKISTVREAIRNSLEDLQRVGGTLNSNHLRTSFTDGSEYSLNVTNADRRPPSWLTIDDKIQKALSNSTIFKSHKKVIDLLIEKTDAALNEMRQFGLRIEFGDDLSGKSRMASWSLPKSNRSSMLSTQESSSSSPPESISSSPGTSSFNFRNNKGTAVEMDDISALLENSQGDEPFLNSIADPSQILRYNRSVSETVGEELSELSTSSLKRSMFDIGQDFQINVEKMCELFLDTIPDIHERHFNKLWISYETIICKKVIDKLTELYVAVYKKPCHTLYRSLVKLSLSQFIIDDKFFQMLMRQSFDNLMDIDDSPTSSTEINLSRSDSDFGIENRSESNLDISKCTLDQLYTLANEECGLVPDEVHNMLDPDSFISAPRRSSFDCVSSISQDSTDSVEKSVTSSKTVEQCYKEAIEKLLSPAMEFIHEAIRVKPLLDKLRCLTKAFRFMSTQLTKMDDSGNRACCDDMLTITTALILDLDCDIFTKLYATINLLIDLKAPFLAGGVHDYCLTNFFSAYHYLFDKQVLERRELISSGC